MKKIPALTAGIILIILAVYGFHEEPVDFETNWLWFFRFGVYIFILLGGVKLINEDFN